MNLPISISNGNAPIGPGIMLDIKKFQHLRFMSDIWRLLSHISDKLQEMVE